MLLLKDKTEKGKPRGRSKTKSECRARGSYARGDKELS